MHSFFDHRVVIEFQPGQAVDIEPGGFGTDKIGVQHGFGEIGDRIEAYRDGLIDEPALFAVTQASELEPPRLVKFADLGTIRIAEGFKLLQEEIIDAGAFADDPRSGLSKGLCPKDIAAGKTPAIDEPIADQQQFKLLIVITEDGAVDGDVGYIIQMTIEQEIAKLGFVLHAAKVANFIW